MHCFRCYCPHPGHSLGQTHAVTSDQISLLCPCPPRVDFHNISQSNRCQTYGGIAGVEISGGSRESGEIGNFKYCRQHLNKLSKLGRKRARLLPGAQLPRRREQQAQRPWQGPGEAERKPVPWGWSERGQSERAGVRKIKRG